MAGDSVHVLVISDDAALRAAHDIAASLRQALEEHDKVAIATEAITSADIATIQLLLAARKQAKALGKSLSLTSPVTGALRELLFATGCLSTDGWPLTPDGSLWSEGQSV